jgi:hypothetical protein
VLGRPVRVTFEFTPKEQSTESPSSGHLVKAAKDLGARPVGQTDEGEDYG